MRIKCIVGPSEEVQQRMKDEQTLDNLTEMHDRVPQLNTAEQWRTNEIKLNMHNIKHLWT